MEETIALFLDPRYGVKQSQARGAGEWGENRRLQLQLRRGRWLQPPEVPCWSAAALAGCPGAAACGMRGPRLFFPPFNCSLPLLPCSPPKQALVKIPDTLVCAMEFIQLPTPKVRCRAGRCWVGGRAGKVHTGMAAPLAARQLPPRSWQPMHAPHLLCMQSCLAGCPTSPPPHLLACVACAVQEQGAALDDLKRAVTRLHPELKDAKAAFWKRKTSVLKVGAMGWLAWWVAGWLGDGAAGGARAGVLGPVGQGVGVEHPARHVAPGAWHCPGVPIEPPHPCLRPAHPAPPPCPPPLPPPCQVHMLLLAHLSREEIPPVLRKDLQFVLTKGLPMLQEMLGLATAPRVKVTWAHTLLP